MSQSGAGADSGLALRRVDSVPEGARVRHFDQLDERAQEQVIARAAGADPAYSGTGLRRNDVVVFTDYFLVVAE